MFAQYFKERENLETFYEDNYFFMYKEVNDFLYIHTWFIKKERRYSEDLKNMVDIIMKIFQESGLESVKCQVQINTHSYKTMLKILFRLGFDIIGGKDNSLYLECKKENARWAM